MITLTRLLALICLLLCGCGKEQSQPQRGEYEVAAGERTLLISLEQVSDSLSRITVKTIVGGVPVHTSVFRLPYPVYRFDVGDVTGNGTPDIAVGVIKTTQYHPVTAKRPFLFKIDEDGNVRKLWMGSRVSQPLEDFVLTKNETPARVLTIEREQSGKFLVAVYRYHGFGLKHDGYIKREISIKEAYKLLYGYKPRATDIIDIDR
ncbi:MAG: hypothetical protein LBB74_09700 [Chitinispirillales bacterium]|jgi:hypothetical protein|nr:hypothetical protein [Chitinispirillales bacterium]